MKRALAFLLLFGSGLLVLRWLEPPPEPYVPPSEEEEVAPAADPGPKGIQFRGPFHSYWYDESTGRTLLYVESDDTDTSQGTDQLIGLRAKIFDPDADEQVIQIRLEAASGWIRRLGANQEFEPIHERRATLAGVRVDILEGTPLVPLTILTPRAEIHAEGPGSRVIRSDAHVDLDSARLQASGEGLTIEPDEGVLVLRREASVEFFQDASRIARLSASGPIRFHRDPQRSASEVTIEAEEGATLELFGANPTRLDGDTIRVRGRESTNTTEGLVIDRVDADGNVTASTDDNEFFGRHAVVGFDAAGALRSATLSGLPSARFSLRHETGILPLPEEELRRIGLSGEGPLELAWGEASEFVMPGPATLSTRGATLRSLGPITGSTRRDREFVSFRAQGGVVLEGDNAVLETPDLDIKMSETDGIPRIAGLATGGPRLVGQLPDERQFHLTSPDRLRVLRVGQHWSVTDATDVVLVVDEPQGFKARARRVHRFESDPLTIEAEGAVRVDNRRGSWRAERLTVNTLTSVPATKPTAAQLRYVLEGTETSKAVFEGPEGRAEALYVLATADELHARRQVRARIHAGSRPDGVDRDVVRDDDDVYDLSADELDLSRREDRDEQSGNLLRRFDLDARGNVEARLIAADEVTSVACRTLTGRRTEVWETDAEDAQSFHSRVEASGDVKTHLTRKEHREDPAEPPEVTRLDIASRFLTVDRSQEAGGVAVSRAEAVEDVEFDMRTDRTPGTGKNPQALSLRGNGHVLVMDGRRSGSLLPKPGERVHTHGRLPSSNVPFELDADEIVFSEGRRLEASTPRIVLENLMMPLEGEVEKGALVARSELLSATEQTLELSGDVEVDAETASGVPWRMTAGRVLFEGSPAQGTEPAELRAVHATGGVDLRLGVRDLPIEEISIASASGDELEGSSLFGTLKLKGKPARIKSPIFDTEADWIEINADLQIIEATSKGRLYPWLPGRPKEAEPPGGSPAPGEKPAADGRSSSQSGRAATPASAFAAPGIVVGTLQDGPQELPLGVAGQKPEWELEFQSSRMLIDADNYILVLQEPRFRQLGTRSELRSSWMLMWLDRSQWKDMPRRITEQGLDAFEPRSDPGDVAPQATAEEEEERRPESWLFGTFPATDFALLREAYFEGPVEVILEGELVARADAIYLDAVSGHGWLAEPTVTLHGHMVGQSWDKLIVQSHWLRHSSDGTLRANDATVTPCEFDKPHIRIVTGDLQIEQKKKDVFSVSLEDNRIEMYDLATLPLPPLKYSADERGRPLWETFSFGDSGRFGGFVSGGIVRPAGKTGSMVNKFLGGNPFDYDASLSFDASYLGSRGVLGDVGMEIKSKDAYWMEMHLGAIPDDGTDRGYIRVPKDDRDLWRLWYRTHGRWILDEGQWIDFAVSKQSDAGVQSEFWESEFTFYEQAETYVEWRKARGNSLSWVTVKPRIQSFQTYLEELPTVAVFNGLTPLAEYGPTSILHTAKTSFSYLRRREGNPFEQSPFGPQVPFAREDPGVFGPLDGLGNRETLRFDALQRLEANTRPGIAGLSLTPFVGGRFTGWSEGQDEDDSPWRTEAQTGVRLATMLWKRASVGRVHQVSPYVQVQGNFVHEADGLPVVYDTTEATMDGNLFEVGTRARFGIDDAGVSQLDVDVKAIYGTNLENGDPDRWLPVEVFARLDVEPWGAPVEAYFDGHYDPQDQQTLYSLTSIATRITEDLRLEAEHQFGRSIDGEELYEAASIGALFHWTEKWEFEGSQTFSLQDNNELDSTFILRRYGHDVVFELESGYARGSGGGSISFNLQPRFGYHPSRLGYLRW